MLFVNDGSRDNSKQRIMEVCARNKDFFYMDLAKNSGLSAAMKAGHRLYRVGICRVYGCRPSDYSRRFQSVAERYC